MRTHSLKPFLIALTLAAWFMVAQALPVTAIESRSHLNENTNAAASHPDIIASPKQRIESARVEVTVIQQSENTVRLFENGSNRRQSPRTPPSFINERSVRRLTSTGAEVAHSFIAFGKDTYQVDADGNKTWAYPHATRDGYQLADGTIVLTLNKGKRYRGGAVVEISPDGTETLIWKGRQTEVNSAQPTDSGTFVITEAGAKPRLIEVDRSGKVIVEFPLQCQTANHHLETRMARKLADGTYLVPHLLDFAVLNYDAGGQVLSKIDTTVPGDTKRKIHTWPFTAIRHGDGHTMVCCTNGNRVVDFDANGGIAWELTNEDLPGPWLQDPCGGQVLPNGNVVIACYAGGRKDPDAPKLFEVNRDKEVIWKYTDGKKTGIHHFQILTTNGAPLIGEILK